MDMRISALLLAGATAFVGLASLSAQSGLGAGSLKVDGLNYESEVQAIYLGDFANARLQPEGNAYAFLLDKYIGAYSRTCAAHLPSNKVEIMASRCVRETVTRNGFGVETNRYCSQSETYGTGRFADPDLLALSKRLESRQAGEILGSILPTQGQAPGASSRRMVDQALAADGDMERLLSQNGCTSPALKRFQANFERFGTGAAPLKLANGATLSSTRGGGNGAAYVPSNYGKMVDALIRENARGWMMNRYMQGSVSNVAVTRKDASGRPLSISARYRFNQLGTLTNGSVTVEYRDGRPVCLYFFDAPNTCRVPSPGVVTAYEKGEYR
ncbi:hypothetical protein EH31_14940 [Erythrobacter longus]|uniref:Uncharacterized protein n=2 Tax=Erythrobacter longus TaxID=1044 RepID=A0A074M5X1_ERYLO|nr:hypothetical protein EH31_14940 [Erythrobacter longus]